MTLQSNVVGALVHVGTGSLTDGSCLSVHELVDDGGFADAGRPDDHNLFEDMFFLDGYTVIRLIAHASHI